MDDDGYRNLIKSYDLATLLEARRHIDAEAYPERVRWLEEEADRRRRGVDPVAPSPPAKLDLSRDEIFAGFIWRFPALAIDLALVYLPYDFAFDLLLQKNRLLPVCLLPLVFPIYNIVCLAWRGQTPGKWLMGILVAAADGTWIRPIQAVKRHVPDLILGIGMSLTAVVGLTSGLDLPAATGLATRLNIFHSTLPLWGVLDGAWTLWIWSEPVLLCLDERRRSMHEFLSGTLVIHKSRIDQLDLRRPFEPSWYDWLESRFAAR